MKAILLVFVMLALAGVTTASTQEEFEAWLIEDSTNLHEYINDSYMCLQFADDLIKNASATDHEMYLVWIDISGDRDHYAVVTHFDDGFVEFYDPGTDEALTKSIIQYGFDGNAVIYKGGYNITSISSVRAIAPWYQGKIGGCWTQYPLFR